jgi:sugar phosphate permease
MRSFSVSGKVLFIICLMYLILYVDRVNISTAAPLIKADLNLSNTELGLAFTAFAYPYALFQLIGGYFGDKFGARLTLFVCGLIVCAATAATGAVGGLLSLFAARLALGIGEGATFPTATRAMAAWVPERSWGFAQGITHSCARIGNAVTPPLIAVLVGLVSWRGAFVVLALFSLIWVLIWWWNFRDVPTAPPLTSEELAALPARGRSSAAKTVPWLKLFRRMLPVTAVDFCYGWTLWLFLSWIPSFFYQNYHQNLTQSAFYSSGVFLAGVIGDTLGGVVSDGILHRTGKRTAARRNVIVAGMLGGFVFLIPDAGSRCQRRRDFARRGILFRRAGGGADLGGAHGHRAELLGIGERNDEFRLRRCRNHFAPGVWLPDRPDRKLDLAICRFDLPVAARRRPSISHASRSALRGGRA